MNRILLAFFSSCLLLASSALPARAQPVDKNPLELTVYAATSLRDALQAIAADYPKDRGVSIVFNFGSSGDLAKQILAAGKADVFFSADELEMDKIATDKRIEAGTRRSLLSNQLVVIEPIDPKDPKLSSFTEPFTPAQLASDKLKRLSLANPETVPAGRYAKIWLDKQKVWGSVWERVLPGVDVRAALAAVESGAAQAGIVYRTDAARSQKTRIVFAVPLADGPKISYPIAALQGRPNVAQAKAFVDYMATKPATDAFERFGFVVLKPEIKSAK